MTTRTVGVEEELLLVDTESGLPRAVSGAVLGLGPAEGEREHDGADEANEDDGDGDGPIVAEMQRQQLETGTRPCETMDELDAEVRRWRRAASDRARRLGTEVVALATSPLKVEPSLSPKVRYRWMVEEFGLTAQEQLTCGCHVHVKVDSDEEGVAVLDRIRPWLAPLLALSGNSPYWHGQDSGYSSFRSQVWSRWPSAGPANVFGSAKAYRDEVRALLSSGTILDEGMVYFDARLSRHHPTVEVRVADVCLDADDTVLIAALVRGLVETAARAWRAGEPPEDVSSALLRLSHWRAARSGVCGQLLHPVSRRPAPAEQVARALVEHVTPALSDHGDLDLVNDRLKALLGRGNGAQAQRAAFHRHESLADVVKEAVARTTA